MVWDIILTCIMWVFGTIIYYALIFQIIKLAFCDLHCYKLFFNPNDDNQIIKMRMRIITILYVVISVIIIVLVIVLGNIWAKLGFLSGLGFCFLSTLDRWGQTDKNIQDYLNGYGKYYSGDRLADLNRSRYEVEELHDFNILMRARKAQALLTSISIISFLGTITGIVLYFLGYPMVTFVCAILSVIDSFLQRFVGEQDNFVMESLSISVGFVVGYFLNIPFYLSMALALCIEHTLVVLIGYIYKIYTKT